MSVLFTKCDKTGEWSSDLCLPDCPEEHVEFSILDREVPRTIADLLNLVRATYAALLDGDNCLDELSDGYRNITGQDIDY